MFSIHPFPGTPPDPLEGIFMLNEETVSAMGDDRIPFQQGLWDGEKPDF